MEHVSPEELIGLYFDGVATAEERQQAQRLLEQSAAARQWLEQLKLMRSALKSLPQLELPRDCTAQVLRRAEQEALRSTPICQPSPATVAGLFAGNRQMWIAMAVAAAALAVVVLPNFFARQGPTGGVALRDQAQPLAESLSDKLATAPAETRDLDRGIQDLTALDGTGTSEVLDHRPEIASSSLAQDEPHRKLNKAAINDPSEEAGKDGRFLADAAPVQEAVGPLSYVYDVATPEAQQAVLRTFEETLREQQIVLENGASVENGELATAASPLKAGTQGGAAATAPGYAFGLPMLQAGQQVEKSLDCVYVVEATGLQLSNTITTLDNLAAQADTSRARRMPERREGERQETQDQAEAKVSEQRAKELGQAQLTPPAVNNPIGGFGNAATSNRSQALRLSTEFADSPTYESSGRGDAPAPAASSLAPAQKGGAVPAERAPSNTRAAAPVPAAPALSAPTAASPAASAPQSDRLGAIQQRVAPADQREPLQRAVIIFRVVPGGEPATDKPRQ